MKSSNTVVTVIVIAAVLIAAYGVGLLVHQARLGNSPASSDTDVNRIESGTGDSSERPRPGRDKDTPEERAKLKKDRAEALKRMESATEEEKAKFREQIRERVGGRRTTQKSGASSDTAQGHPPRQDPNAMQKSNGTGAEPNAAGQK